MASYWVKKIGRVAAEKNCRCNSTLMELPSVGNTYRTV